MVRKAQRGTLLNMGFTGLDDRYDQLQLEEDEIYDRIRKVGKNTKEQKNLKRRLKLVKAEQEKTKWAIRRKKQR